MNRKSKLEIMLFLALVAVMISIAVLDAQELPAYSVQCAAMQASGNERPKPPGHGR